MTNTNAGKDISMEDKKAFERTYKDNASYCPIDMPDKDWLRNFVSYYESCKTRAPTNQGKE